MAISDIQHKGNFYNVFDGSKKIKDLHAPAVGEFRSVSGRNVIFKKGNFVDTYDISGKKINSRHSP